MSEVWYKYYIFISLFKTGGDSFGLNPGLTCVGMGGHGNIFRLAESTHNTVTRPSYVKTNASLYYAAYLWEKREI